MKGQAALKTFLEKLNGARNATLLLDYDGTLAPFRIDRSKALPYAGVRLILQSIRERTATRLVIISGRSLDDLLPVLGMDSPPEIWGCHGWERLDPSGHRSLYPLAKTQAAGLEKGWSVIEELQLAEFCECKPASVALHWRGLPATEAGKIETAVRRAWMELTPGQMLELHPFDGGLELRASGRTKATAVYEVLDSLEEGQPVAFLGDDLTDEDGFRAVRGHGLGILVRKTYRPTAAEVHLRPPGELLDFLNEWLRRTPRRPLISRKRGKE